MANALSWASGNAAFVTLRVAASILPAGLGRAVARHSNVRIDDRAVPWEKVRNFRTARDFDTGAAATSACLDGLANLSLSGSSQFTPEGLSEVLRRIPSERVTVIDLRQESHGYVDGAPTSWANVENDRNRGASASEVAFREEALLARHESGCCGHDVATEEAVCSARGVQYQRLPVTDHNRPPDALVDSFVAMARSLPSDGWLHVHCKAGKGRTTSFMAMYDMLRNAPRVPFQDILQRQRDLGGADLLATKSAAHEERLAFLRDFYDYCRDQGAAVEPTSWSAWRREKGQRPAAR